LNVTDKPITVLVIAVGGNVSQGILKALAKSTLDIRVVGADISAPQMGLYTVDRGYVAPWANDSAFIPWLLETCHREGVQVILSGAEAVLAVLASEKGLIEKESGALCLVSDHDVIAIGDDKLRTCRWLQEQGFNFPQFSDAEDGEAVAELAREVGFPLIAKPRIGGGARGLLEVQNEKDLEYVVGKSGYVVQEYLPDDESEYTVGCFCDRDGVVRGSIGMRRNLLSGTTYRAFLGDFPEVREEAERITRALKPLGPCNVQLRLTDRGPVCFEINARFSGTTPIRAHYGFNEVDAALRHFLLGDDSISFPKVTSGVALRYWNELYVEPDAQEVLERDGLLPDPGAFEVGIEEYGKRP
jgi:carbamoyl-phosphate synthase large subunit